MTQPGAAASAKAPSLARLVRSIVIGVLAAGAITVTIVLPAEYGIDPTGVGDVLGLTEMGETKQRLAQEALEHE
jgi:hypothetical protein